jgi:hypothetical protein
MRINKSAANMAKSEIIKDLPLACSDEKAAVEFFEKQLWQGKPHCPHCQSESVYQMMDAKTGGRVGNGDALRNLHTSVQL